MVDFGLHGKNALVTGGTAGIGKAVAAEFASAAAAVAIVGRRTNGQAIADEIGATFIKADITDRDEVGRMFAETEERIGPLDIVVLNAGIDPGMAVIPEIDQDAFERNLDVNYRHVFWGLQSAPGHMNDGGSIIVTASTLAVTNVPATGHYAASKAAALSLARTAALELGERGIRVNTVMPGTTLSEMTPSDHWEIEVMKTMLPLGRHAIAEEDLVGLYQFLASDASRYLTGQAIACDAGMTAGFSYGLLRGVGTPL